MNVSHNEKRRRLVVIATVLGAAMRGPPKNPVAPQAEDSVSQYDT